MTEPNKFFDQSKLLKLIHYHNYFHLCEDDFPIGYLSVQLDDGYTGECYSIEFEYNNGEFILSVTDTGLYYVLTQHNGDYQHGKIEDSGKEERDKIAKLIRKTIK